MSFTKSNAAHDPLGSAMAESRQLYGRLEADQEGFLALAAILDSNSGISMPATPKNMALMASRMSSILRERGLHSYADFLALIRTQGKQPLDQFICAMTTNTTQFFRENEHFEFLKSHLPKLVEQNLKAGKREIRIWCSAASTGQEPYTLAIVASEVLEHFPGVELKLLATDIDRQVLLKACRGQYSESEVAQMPDVIRHKYFARLQPTQGNTQTHGTELQWQVLPALMRKVRFAPLNLNDHKYPFAHAFDVIFCRNVLIYFTPERATAVIDHLIENVRSGGTLFVGHSESGRVINKTVKSLIPAAFEKLGGK